MIKLLYLNIKKCFILVRWNLYWIVLVEMKIYKKEAVPIIGNSLLKCSMNYIGILPSQVLT